MSKIGKVYLVGAGPGDPKLITLKGLEILKGSDIVFYDYLANEDLLEYLPDHAEKIYVGKKGNYKSISQIEIEDRLIKAAKSGKIVVRLKGGDPYLFGRGGEEALRLSQEKIPFEIIPGVSSITAVPAYAGIPLTHRDFTSEVAIITGHHSDQNKSGISWSSLASFRTIIILMGTANLEKNLKELVKTGLDPETKAALISWGTYPSQKTLIGNISNLHQKLMHSNLKPPAILVIGEVVGLKDKLSWFESKPLFGKKILITRAVHQNSKLKNLLENHGAEVISLPIIDIKALDDLSKVDQSINQIKKYQWLFFTSQNAVDIFWQRLMHLKKDNRDLAHLKIGVVGAATKKRVEEFGGWIDLMPNDYHADALAKLCVEKGLKNQKVLFPRALKGRDELPIKLTELGCTVDLVPVYQTVKTNLEQRYLIEILKDKLDWIILASSSSVENFCDLLGKDQFDLLENIKIAVMGPITKKTLNQYQLNESALPSKSTLESLIQEIIKKEHE
jgi:uroporphyrinogen III methyltransferase/synthase